MGKRRYVIALNEPRGEGNGWEPCADDAPGVLFYVEEDDEEAEMTEALEVFRTRSEAENWLQTHSD